MNARAAERPGNPASITRCDREPIHIPGSIQPHGALLAVEAGGERGFRVSHASANLLGVLGHRAEAALGMKLADLLGAETAGLLCEREPVPEQPAPAVELRHGTRGDLLQLRAHRSGNALCIDIERVETRVAGVASVATARAVVEQFLHASTTLEMCALAVRGLRAVSGFERVMAYRFDADGHGEVVAESLAAGNEPFLGLRYPADDIPAQARRLYLRQRVGSVADCRYEPVPLLRDPRLPGDEPLDLTHSVLRSVSPLHREYMRNMGTRASLTIAVSNGTGLWGLLVCHHSTPKVAGPELRAVADLVGTVVSLLAVRLGETELLSSRQERHATLRAVIDRLAAPGTAIDALRQAEPALLRLVGASGAVLRVGGTVCCIGRTPDLPVAERALAAMQICARGALLAVGNVGERVPALRDCTAEASGALYLPLGQRSDDAILWLRPELPRTVRWGGEPGHVGEPHHAPRTSFAAWLETVRGQSEPWTEVDCAVARDLGQAVEADLAYRSAAALAALRHTDFLLGQPDRQRDLERSNAALEEFAYAASHDLKAPLRAIGHLAQWIAEDIGPQASAETAENLSLLQGRVARLQSLLDGLLVYCRVGRQADQATDTVSLDAIVSDVVASQDIPPGFEVECRDECGPIVTHRAPLCIVLANLICNAVRHHDRSSGRIVVCLRRVEGIPEFRVEDDGPGIAPRFHERVFQIFQTLASRDEVEASGIGLAVVKRYVEAHEGRIRIESAPPERGCTFAFTWHEAPP